MAGCKCATFDPDDGRYSCSVSGDGCMYLIPNSKRCAEDYREGPDAHFGEAVEIESESHYPKVGCAFDE